MRTLDEVIKAVAEDLEQAETSYPESFYDYDNHKDALHYLREYKKLLEAVAENATTEMECAKNAQCKDVERALRTERAWQSYRKERNNGMVQQSNLR